MKLIKKCSCNYKGKRCRYIVKLLEAFQSLGNDYSTEEIIEITVSQFEEYDWKVTKYGDSCEIKLEVDCAFVKRTSLDNVRDFFIRVLEDREFDDEDEEEETKCFGDCKDEDVSCDECRCSEECCDRCGDPCYGDCQDSDVSCEDCRCSAECCDNCGGENEFSNLSPEDKIRSIAKKLCLPENQLIKIVEDGDINGYTDGREIGITSGAIQKLSEEELAYILGHEQGHIDGNHIEKTKAFIAEKCRDMERITSDKKAGFFKKAIKIAGKSILGVVEFSGMSYEHEIEADLRSKRRIKESGYSGNGGSDLMDRFTNQGHGFSITHPDPKVRKKIMDQVE